MEAKTKELWVFIETTEDGGAHDVGLELLAQGRELAAKQGGALTAVVLGHGVDRAVDDASRHGADQVIVADAPELAPYTTDAFAYTLCALIEKHGPASLLIGATSIGRDLAPRVACRLHTGLTADCIGLGIDEESGCVAWTRPAFGGNLMATIICPERRPQMGTVRPGVFKKGPETAPSAHVIREEIRVPEGTIRTKVLEILHDAAEEGLDLDDAEIVIAGGRGAAGPDGFAKIRELANALGGSVGASRPPVESGWVSRAIQIGQTGHTVRPKLYIACGISGAIQHLSGVADADMIIAINKDPEAPIFKAADYGIVGDMFEILPVLTEEIKRAKA